MSSDGPHDAPHDECALPLDVKRRQEWLNLHGFVCEIDGADGPATRRAASKFRATKAVTERDMDAALVAPLARARRRFTHAAQSSVNECAVSYAMQHLRERPHEVGGPNAGPWVREYCGGHDGPEFLWCLTAALYWVRQGLAHKLAPDPFPNTMSCDVLGAWAAENGHLLRIASADNPPTTPRLIVKPGDLFLVYRGEKADGSDDWTHAGLISSWASDSALGTIEGNSNSSGSRNGVEVCARSRTPRRLDIVTLDPLSERPQRAG